MNYLWLKKPHNSPEKCNFSLLFKMQTISRCCVTLTSTQLQVNNIDLRQSLWNRYFRRCPQQPCENAVCLPQYIKHVNKVRQLGRGPWGFAICRRCRWLEVWDPLRHTQRRTQTEAMSCSVRHPGAVLLVPCQGREMICESWGSSQLMCTGHYVPVQPG